MNQFFGKTDIGTLFTNKSRYKSYVIPGETLIPGGRSVSPLYWIYHPIYSNLQCEPGFRSLGPVRMGV